jgi:hypothetical protein
MSLLRVFKTFAKDKETDWWFTILVGIPYLALLIWMHIHHEMWRDEVHAWTLSRLAQGFSELVTGDRIYEGHPPLWYWYLHVWSRFIKEAWGIQVATITAAMTAAVLLLRFAPFPRYLKTLLLFSYYFGFEYTVISRNYVLGWLLVCLFCSVYHPLRVRHLALGIILSLLSLTSVYGLFMSVCLLMFLLADQVRLSFGSSPVTVTVSASPRLLGALAVTLATIFFCVTFLQPPYPHPFSPNWNFATLNFSAVPQMLSRLAAGDLPLRNFSIGFWLSPFTLWDANTAWPNYVGGGLLLLSIASLYPSWRLMLTYLVAITAMAVFQQTRFPGQPRHWGHYFMFFVAACWLARKVFPRGKHKHLMSTLLLLGMLAFQVQSFITATVQDTRWAFSGGRETATFIRRAGLQDLPIVAGPDWFVIPVAGYLRRPFISVETEEVNETVVFHSRRRVFSVAALVARAVELSRAGKKPVLIVSNQPIALAPEGARLSLLFTSGPATLSDEIFSVYRVLAF